MKKLLISLASGLVLDVLIAYAVKQRDGSVMMSNIDRWTSIIAFLEEMKVKGLPL